MLVLPWKGNLTPIFVFAFGKATENLILGGDSADQMPLFPEKQGDDNARHHA
jgi:hypothetical protein